MDPSTVEYSNPNCILDGGNRFNYIQESSPGISATDPHEMTKTVVKIIFAFKQQTCSEVAMNRVDDGDLPWHLV